MKITRNVKRYMRLVAKKHCDEFPNNDATRLCIKIDSLWDSMTRDEQDAANRLVLIVFGDRI